MITLLTYPAAFGQPATSPFCVKAMWMLDLAGVPWEREDTLDPRKLPFGKLPAIRVKDTLIPDSDNIRAYLAETGHDVDAHLTEVQQADARAFTRMAEEHLYFHLVMDRWGNDAVWPTIRDVYFDMIPKPLRGFITRGIRKQALQGLNFLGHARLSREERLARVEQDLVAISARLWGGPYLVADAPCSADLSMAAILAAMGSTPVPTALSRRISEDQQLMDYIDRVRTACCG